MNLEAITDDDLDYITILHQKEEKKDLMYAALEFCAQKRYKDDEKNYNNFINNLSNENFLMAHIDNLLKTSMFFIWCCECDDKLFESNKSSFLEQTLEQKNNTPELFRFRVFYVENNEKIVSHIENVNEAKKMRYFRRINPIIEYLTSI